MKRLLSRILLVTWLAFGLNVNSIVGANGQVASMIGDIIWYQVDSYCSFSRRGHKFDYNDPSSWRFVFLTNLSQPSFAYMHLGGALRELRKTGEAKTGKLTIQNYQTWGENPYEITVVMDPKGSGTEHTDFEGSIAVTYNGKKEEVIYSGDCGV